MERATKDMPFSTETQEFLKLAEASLRFDYQSGRVTPITRPHTTGWRRVPSWCTAQLIDGHVHMQVEGHDECVMEAGGLFAIPSNTLHCIELITDGQAYSRWSHFNFEILEAIDVLSLFETPLIYRGKAAQELGDINAALGEIDSSKQRTLVDVLRKKALGFRLLELLACGSTLKPDSIQRLTHARRMAPALAFIDEHLDGDLSRERLAQRVNLSSSRFHAVFRDAVGIGPREYIQRRRMARAQQLLAATDQPIREIAGQVGYADAFHFSRAFKNAVKVSPNAYRAGAKPGGM